MTKRDRPAPPDDLLLVTPVQSTYRGANGWTTEVQRAFVAALARCGVVAAAARSVGRSPRSAYQLRKRAGEGSQFARAWDTARAIGGDRAVDAGVQCATEPRRVEVWHRGRFVGWRTTYENRLAFAALRALDRRAESWAATGLDATKLLADIAELPNEREM